METEEGLRLLQALNALEEPPVGTNSAEPPQGGMSREQGKELAMAWRGTREKCSIMLALWPVGEGASSLAR